jgi:hypothetical protein
MGKMFKRAAAVAGIGITAAAVIEQLRKPAEDRTWHGRVLGVPYDFRPPTVGRLAKAYWSPGNRALLTPMPFGVGYAVNLARVAALVKRDREPALASHPGPSRADAT